MQMIKEFNLKKGGEKIELFSEKAVCFELSTGTSSAQSILNLIPSSFHHGLSARPEHLPIPTTSVHLKSGLCAHMGYDFETQ